MDKARIGQGEAEALVLPRRRDVSAVIDDKEARAIAKGWNLEYKSIPVSINCAGFEDAS